ncbi:hypothetical protein [Streptomyces sp. S3(2020)]|uniref:aromatic-ring hydroxylase C-terminal domain-containing protein n=1 Tax=Streptomyces sp. S3(2020) TaxID=2732044 RepID=UPI0032169D86
MFQAQSRRREQLQNGEAASDRIELPWSDGYFAQLGLVLGVTYRSAAVLTGGADAPEPPDAGTEYVPTPEPGHRMPHLWLTPDHSTIDAVGEWFTLLTPDPDPWKRCVSPPWPLRVEPLPAEHLDACELSPHGALLIRPDGHIAARWPDGPPADSALRNALATLTGTGSDGRPYA